LLYAELTQPMPFEHETLYQVLPLTTVESPRYTSFLPEETVVSFSYDTPAPLRTLTDAVACTHFNSLMALPL